MSRKEVIQCEVIELLCDQKESYGQCGTCPHAEDFVTKKLDELKTTGDRVNRRHYSSRRQGIGSIRDKTGIATTQHKIIIFKGNVTHTATDLE